MSLIEIPKDLREEIRDAVTGLVWERIRSRYPEAGYELGITIDLSVREKPPVQTVVRHGTHGIDEFLAQRMSDVYMKISKNARYVNLVGAFPILGMVARFDDRTCTPAGIGNTLLKNAREWLSSQFPVLCKRYMEPMGPLEKEAFGKFVKFSDVMGCLPFNFVHNRAEMKSMFQTDIRELHVDEFLRKLQMLPNEKQPTVCTGYLALKEFGYTTN